MFIPLSTDIGRGQIQKYRRTKPSRIYETRKFCSDTVTVQVLARDHSWSKTEWYNASGEILYM